MAVDISVETNTDCVYGIDMSVHTGNGFSISFPLIQKKKKNFFFFLIILQDWDNLSIDPEI